MKTELVYLALTAALTGVLWIPYILDRISVQGLAEAVGYPENPKPQSQWARRMMKAHTNAVENLVVFSALVLTANAVGVVSVGIGTAAIVCFWARVVHAVAYTFGIPLVRTLSFAVGFFCQAWIAWLIFVP